MFETFTYTKGAPDDPGDIVDFLMDVGTDAYIGMTDWDPEIADEGEDRTRARANASWATFNYFNKVLIPIQADLIAQSPEDFVTLYLYTMQTLMPDTEIAQETQLHGQLRARLSGQTEDFLLPVQIKSAPKFDIGAISPSAAPFTVTFQAFRPYWFGEDSEDYFWIG